MLNNKGVLVFNEEINSNETLLTSFECLLETLVEFEVEERAFFWMSSGYIRITHKWLVKSIGIKYE